MQFCRIHYNAAGGILHIEAQTEPFINGGGIEDNNVVEVWSFKVAGIVLTHVELVTLLSEVGDITDREAEASIDEAEKLSRQFGGREIEFTGLPFVRYSHDSVTETIYTIRRAKQYINELRRKSPSNGEPEFDPATRAENKTAITDAIIDEGG